MHLSFVTHPERTGWIRADALTLLDTVGLDRALASRVYRPLDEAIHKSLAAVTLDDILTAIDEEKDAASLMYFI